MKYFSIKQFKIKILFGIQILFYGSYTILVHLSEKNGTILFSTTAMNFTIEIIKLFISFASYLILKHFYHRNKWSSMYFLEESNNHSNLENFKLNKFLMFCIPSLLYFVNNNLAVYIQLYMDSTSYQMLSNFKILSTAIMYYFIMKKRLTKMKWFSLLLLFIAGCLYVCGNLKSNMDRKLMEQEKQIDLIYNEYNINEQTKTNYQLYNKIKEQIFITKLGLLMMCIYCIISGLAGVYTEFLLKSNSCESIFLQNIYLYISGCFFNLIGYFVECNLNRNFKLNTDLFFLKEINIFKGFNFLTWIIIFSQVYNGLAMSFLMKYSNNITKLFVISSSLLVTTLMSIYFFSLKINIYFCFVFFVIMFSLYLYFVSEK
jgi:probable UDP-sugar transporter A4